MGNLYESPKSVLQSKTFLGIGIAPVPSVPASGGVVQGGGNAGEW